MDTTAAKPSGLLAAAGTLVESVLGSVRNRVQLLSVELQEEKLRLVQLIIWVSAAVFSAMMTIAFATVTIVSLFWDNARLAALGIVTLFYALCLIIVCWRFRRYLDRQPKPFEATLGELDKDRACFRQTA